MTILRPFIPLRTRSFSSSSSRRKGHYEILGVPQNATKSQIKSSFYQLSKRYHPDVTNDPAATKAFQAMSEAYTVLSNDRQRRAYDRSLILENASSMTASSATYNPQWSYETRRRGATHAWESHRRPSHHKPHPKTYQKATGPRSATQDRNVDDPFLSRYPQNYSKKPTDGYRYSDADRVQRESTFWRTMQVIGLVLIITTLSGGWR